jgi:hypothetical protein
MSPRFPSRRRGYQVDRIPSFILDEGMRLGGSPHRFKLPHMTGGVVLVPPPESYWSENCWNPSDGWHPFAMTMHVLVLQPLLVERLHLRQHRCRTGSQQEISRRRAEAR